jgi:hypothetical protein
MHLSGVSVLFLHIGFIMDGSPAKSDYGIAGYAMIKLNCSHCQWHCPVASKSYSD